MKFRELGSIILLIIIIIAVVAGFISVLFLGHKNVIESFSKEIIENKPNLDIDFTSFSEEKAIALEVC